MCFVSGGTGAPQISPDANHRYFLARVIRAAFAGQATLARLKQIRMTRNIALPSQHRSEKKTSLQSEKPSMSKCVARNGVKTRDFS